MRCFSPALSVRNADQQELDSSYKSDSAKLTARQPDDGMLRLRKLRVIYSIVI